MEVVNIQDTLKRINADLERISEELSRPDEDVVTISVCHGARKVVTELMQTYLHAKGEPLHDPASLTHLLNECSKHLGEFSAVSLTGMACSDMHHSECNGKYCLDVTHVNDCVVTASKLKSIILRDLSISESE